jgi:hypothetical protein
MLETRESWICSSGFEHSHASSHAKQSFAAIFSAAAIGVIGIQAKNLKVF